MLFFLFVSSREGMDSSSDEEDEQYFETLEDIASSSDAETCAEEKKHTNSSHDEANAYSATFSKYDVWKNSPGSILERRQRLFMQMGLKLEREDSENSAVLLDTALTGSFPAPASSNPKNEHSGQNHRNADCSIDDGVSGSTTCAPNAGYGRTMVRSRSDGTFCRLQNSENVGGYSLRLVRSGTTSPVLCHGAHKRLGDSSGAVLRAGSGSVHLPSKPPLGAKRVSSRNTAASSAEGSVARKLQFQWNKFGRFRVTDKNGNSLFHSDAKVTGETRAPRLPLVGANGDTVSSKDGEVLCRIKDLDSGKEFVVNEVGKDGLWNKLKELDSGREITLEEFESTLGLSPIVQEVMRRERAAGDSSALSIPMDSAGAQKRKKGWFKAFREVVRGSREKGNSSQNGSGSDKEASTEKSSRKSGSATDDSQDTPLAARPVKVRVHKKSVKEFGDLRLKQEIQAHQAAIWTMKFSLDGCYLATAGQDRVVKVWEVLVHNSSRSNGSPTSSGELNIGPDMLADSNIVQRHNDSKKSSKSLSGRKDANSELPMPFMLSENAKCTFMGHKEDILDLSWSPSQCLLSSSMDKTVRLWNISSKTCLKIFTHNDYVTCIQFHPLDPGHFISGSLDGKVRIWCIQEPQVIDWVDLQEMVTAACYTPNGQGAVVGSYKGTCRFYKTPGNKLQLDTTFQVQSTKTKRSQGKEITGFQFVPGDNMKILITSNDSRVRVYDGTEISSKYKGFRNSKSHISASFSRNGKFIICASEDSRVCIWNYNDASYDYSGAQRTIPGAYEDFSAKHVLVAIPWAGLSKLPTPGDSQSSASHLSNDTSSSKERLLSHQPGLGPDDKSSTAVVGRPAGLLNASRLISSLSDLEDARNPEFVTNPKPTSRPDSASKPPRSDAYWNSCCGNSLLSNCVPAQHIGNSGFFSDYKGSATWPEEKLPSLQQSSPSDGPLCSSNNDAIGMEHSNLTSIASAWGLVIVTGGLGGEIRVFQNYSLPVRL